MRRFTYSLRPLTAENQGISADRSVLLRCANRAVRHAPHRSHPLGNHRRRQTCRPRYCVLTAYAAGQWERTGNAARRHLCECHLFHEAFQPVGSARCLGGVLGGDARRVRPIRPGRFAPETARRRYGPAAAKFGVSPCAACTEKRIARSGGRPGTGGRGSNRIGNAESHRRLDQLAGSGHDRGRSLPAPGIDGSAAGCDRGGSE